MRPDTYAYSTASKLLGRSSQSSAGPVVFYCGSYFQEHSRHASSSREIWPFAAALTTSIAVVNLDPDSATPTPPYCVGDLGANDERELPLGLVECVPQSCTILGRDQEIGIPVKRHPPL